MRHVKAQVTSLDIIISIIIVLVMMGVIAVILTMFFEASPSREYYGGQVFTNVESLNGSIAFLSDHRVDEAKLVAFSGLDYESRIKPLVLADMERFSSIKDDVCIFFTAENQIIPVGNKDTIGMTLGPGGTKAACDPNDPCREYRESFAYVKPVLRQSGPDENRIAKMSIVVCAG